MARDGAEHWRPEEPKARGPLGLWASAIFNICIVALPIAGAYAVHVVGRDHLYTYEATPAAANQARTALNKLAASLITEPDRRAAWDDRVANALMSSDIQAARGLMLSARAMLPPGDVSQINRNVSINATDAELESAALDLLTPGTRARYESRVPLLARRIEGAAPPSVSPQAFIVVGDADEFEAAAVHDLEDEHPRHLAFVLMGLGVVLAGENSQQALEGASVIQAGLTARRLSAVFEDALAAQAEAALPRAAFRIEVARQATMGVAPQERASLMQSAFRASLDAQGLAALRATLARIGEIAEAAGPQGALALLRHARSADDLERLELLAKTNPDRAVAVARFAPVDGALIEAGRGQLRITAALLWPLAGAILAFVLIAAATIATAAQALMRALEHAATFEPPRARKPKAKRGAHLIREFRG